MNTKPKILAFAGSARTDSYNKKLIKIAAEAAQKAGAEVTLIDLRDYSIPLYEGDLEAKEGTPLAALKIRELMIQSQGLLLAAPEYNSSITPLLKNTLDWISRPHAGQDGLLPYKNKVTALLSASPGALGGMRGLVTLRSMLGNMGVLVLPEQVCIMKAHEAFDAEGNFKDVKQQKAVEGITGKLVEVLNKLSV